MCKIDLWCLTPFVILVLIFLYNSRHNIRTIILAYKLPGPPALLFLGNIFLVKDSRELLKFANSATEKYGKLFRGWLTIIPIIIVTDPKHLQIILGSKKLTDKNFLYLLMHTFIGNGLITSNGSKWKLHRKYIQPYFQLNNLEIFIPMFSEAAKKMVANLNELKSIKVTNCINSCILDILHLTILGIPMTDESTIKKSPIRHGNMVLIKRVLKPWLLWNSLYKLTSNSQQETSQKVTLHEFIQKILDQRKVDKKENLPLRFCLLHILMEISENNESFTDEDIVNEACTFLLAGQDSVGAAIAFTLYYLAKHQDVQAKVLQEVDIVSDNFDHLSIKALNEMKYLEQCIKETMRLQPSVPIIARKLSEDVKLDNHIIPVGTDIFVSPYLTHRLPEYYPNPEEFNPDRFSTDSQVNRNQFAYLPFSAGPRNCIGYKFAMLEMKTVIYHILQKYAISLPTEYEIQIYYRVTMRAKGGLTLQLSPRTQTN